MVETPWEEGDSMMKDPELAAAERYEVISKYVRLLERYSSPLGRETDLPYPKAVIRTAIFQELYDFPDSEQRSFLEIAFAQLECFLPADEFKAIHDFKRASALAQEIAKSGKPTDLLASAGILNQAGGETAVKILEDISRTMRRRILEIRAINLLLFRTRGC